MVRLKVSVRDRFSVMIRVGVGLGLEFLFT